MTKCVTEAVTPENRNETLPVWLVGYIDGGTAFDSLSDEQQVFVEAYDGVMAGILNGSIPDPENKLLQGRTVREMLADDGWVDIEEWKGALSKRYIVGRSDERIPLKNALNTMGPQNAALFEQLTAGVINGLVDQNEDDKRYNVETEFRGLYSGKAIEMVSKTNQLTIAQYLNPDVLTAAAELMESICATIETKQQPALCESDLSALTKKFGAQRSAAR